MSASFASTPKSTPRNNLWRTSCWLAAVVAVLGLTVTPLAIWQQGTQGLLQLSAAALLCLIPSLIAAALTCRLLGPHADPTQALSGVVLSMGFRLLPPLVVCMLLALKGTGQQYLYFVSYLILFYLAALAVETVFTVQSLQQQSE